MSRLHLVESRRGRQRRWRQWLITDGRAAAIRSAQAILRSNSLIALRPADHARAVCIDTDAGTVTVCWEGRR